MRLRSGPWLVLILLVLVQLVNCYDSGLSTSLDRFSPQYESSSEDVPSYPPYGTPEDDSSESSSEDSEAPPSITTPAPSTPAPLSPTVPSGLVMLNMKLLLVGTSAKDTYFLSAKLTLDSVGALYDTVFVGAIPELASANGVGKYGGIIVSATSLDDSLYEELNNYQMAYGVRKVTLYATPKSPTMRLLGSVPSQLMSFMVQDATYTNGVQLSFSDSVPFGHIASVLDSSAVTPVVVGKLVDGSETVVAAVIQRSDGTKDLEFYIPPTFGSGYSLAFGNIWLQWVSGGIFVGLRRILWSIQVDDLFLSTELFDPATSTLSETAYRCTPEDIINLETVVSMVNEYIPGSNIRVEFAFNGAGIQLEGGLSADPLYLELKQRLNSFFYESHTFTHPSLDDYSYEQTIAELSPNLEIARDFFGTSSSTTSYSSSAMVTPSISGLFNGEVLRALAAMGITNVVGDNSRPELVPENKYHGIYTSVAIHGFNGIFIVPRHVSDIYYDVSTPEAEVAQYAQIYGVTKTIREIVVIQAQAAAQNLLAYRHDPFMFHQANLGSFSMMLGGQERVTSLLSMWIANTFSQLTRFSTLPLWTYKHEELATIWKEREVRDKCQVDVQAIMTGHTITGLYLASAKTCRYALTGVSVQPVSGIISTEVYGPDVTTWVNLTAGHPLQLTLTTPVSL